MLRFWHANPLDPIDEAAKSLRSSFDSEIEETQEAGLVPILSHERISGNPHRGGRDARDIADKLNRAFPEARVFMVIREQASMLASLYNTYVRMGGAASLEEYVFAQGGGGEIPLFRFDFLEYHRLISYYQCLFGTDRVLVLPYEMLDAQPRVFVQKLTSFSGAEMSQYPKVKRVNNSPSAASIAVKRYVNKLFVHNGFNPTPLLPLRINNMTLRQLTAPFDRKLPEKLRERSDHHLRTLAGELVGDRYRKSNARTESLADLDLSKFGYPC